MRPVAAWLIAALAGAAVQAAAGTGELEALRSAEARGQGRPAGLTAEAVLGGLRPEQRREALYLLSLVPARPAQLDALLRSVAAGGDELAETAALERLYAALLTGDARAAVAAGEAFASDHAASPRLPEALLLVARTLLQAGEVQRASEQFLQVLLRYPASGEARMAQLGLGDCYLAEGRLAEARSQYELAAKAPAESGDCQGGLRQVSLARRQEDELAAARLLSALLEACPGGLAAYEAVRLWPELAAAAPEPAAPAASGRTTYWVQIGAYAERANAERLAGRLEGERDLLRVEEVVLEGRTVFKVLYGPFASDRDASAAVTELEQRHNLFGFVFRQER
jgi:TolA-binding protein